MHRTSGFSLVEILVSLGLLALVLTTVIGLFLSSYAVASSSAGMTTAGQVANNALTQLKNQSYTVLAGQAGGAASSSQVSSNGIAFTVTSQVQALNTLPGYASENADVLRLLITVTWTDNAVLAERGLDGSSRKSHSVFMESQVSTNAQY